MREIDFIYVSEICMAYVLPIRRGKCFVIDKFLWVCRAWAPGVNTNVALLRRSVHKSSVFNFHHVRFHKAVFSDTCTSIFTVDYTEPQVAFWRCWPTPEACSPVAVCQARLLETLMMSALHIFICSVVLQVKKKIQIRCAFKSETLACMAEL